MIKFEGIEESLTKDISIIKFSNEKNAIVEIPIPKNVAQVISLYLGKISLSYLKPVERANDGEHD